MKFKKFRGCKNVHTFLSHKLFLELTNILTRGKRENRPMRMKKVIEWKRGKIDEKSGQMVVEKEDKWPMKK